ncbi:TPA: hypothetical protein SIC70_002153 [Pasteurella multocida]|uniref:hypothetical protein n=1 Tax=Pasteurella multocida TaxID=747 RepID=UPI0029B47188|nr:hypothetical protein [Pasteurella multocida]MEB4587008.1 hypothetical protein [Pasteurella multocida]HEH9717248.1 hypothetical protein [Pasteurella multocida]HEH9728190.1 hypothetical protein [Pasteurella multocida]HEH9735317.1 hypothetical protein [Pasteurella multocida]HEH9766924.1 hypothetical protein [Pasteurella multocida]
MSTEKEQKVLLTLEIEMDEVTADNLAFSKDTEILGGKVKRINWEGSLFEELEWHQSLLDHNAMTFLVARENTDEKIRNAISKALQKLVSEIEEEEELISGEDDMLPY